MGAALVLLLVGLGAMAAGVLIGRYYVPDDRQLRRTARHSRAYMRALSHLIARDHETAVSELRTVVEENVDDVEPYFALGAMFRSHGEHERAIRVHQALALRERDRRKLRQRAMYELGLDFRAAGMPRRATRAMEEVLLEDPGHEGALRVLAALYEEQARFNEAAGLWQRLGRRRGEDTGRREHHLLVAAAQAALGRDDLDSAKQLLKAAQKHEESAHFYAAAAELAAARDNHRGAKERLKQALLADPALAPHLLPGLIAAERGLVAHEASGAKHRHGDDDLADEPGTHGTEAAAPAVPQLSAPAVPQLSAPAVPQLSAPAVPQLSAPAVPQLAAPAVPQLPAAPAAPQLPVAPAAASSAPGETAGGVVESAASAGAAAPAASTTPTDAPGAGALVAAPRTDVATAATVGQAAETAALMASLRGAETTAAHRRIMLVAAIDGEAGKPPPAAVIERVLAVLDEVEAQSGPRLELALIRAQLVPATDAAAQAALATRLTAQFPGSLAARVAAARLASASHDPAAIRGALDGLVADTGALAWTLRGRWQCAHCGHRPQAFSWRCGQCRRWSTLRMETGIEPPAVQPRERRAAPRTARPDGLLGASPDQALPAATLDPGLSDAELATAGVRRSLLGRVGGWVSGVWRRGAS
jgi:lipopolysaccharide biosynthesis regulator YciM